MGITSYDSVIAGNFVQPLVTLVANLVAKKREGVPGKSNEHELDWSLPTILLTVVMFESYLGWVQRHGNTGVPPESSAYKFYEALRDKHPKSLPDVTEAFIMRDMIAHNHVWSVDFEWGESPKVLSIKHVVGGDRKWEQSIDIGKGMTASGLHVIPTMVDRQDVKGVLQMVVGAMESLIAIGALLPQALTSVGVWPGDWRRIALRHLPKEII
jgi:hypothetical protein